jgi:hypothetical protein
MRAPRHVTVLAMPALAHRTSAPIHADVYRMSMFSERLQILVSKEQRRRLEAEAKRRDASVASVIRDAVDAELGVGSRAAKLAAVEAIRGLPRVPLPPIEELNRLIDEAHDEEIRRGIPPLPTE